MSKIEKTRIRAFSLARRDALSDGARDDAAQKLAAFLDNLRQQIGAGPLSGFWPIRSEIDPRPAMLRFAARGVTLALPVVNGSALVFRRWRDGDIMDDGPYGLKEPRAEASLIEPQAMIVPLSAFDRRGHRIGYGAGFYDRAIADLSKKRRPFTVGVGFSVQEIDHVPDETHDIPLDYIITEKEIIRP